MDANEFLKKVKPAAQRSRVAPFWNDITKLRGSGCTLEQVCEFLAANGVQISIAGLSKYIKRREEKGETERARGPVSEGKPEPVSAPNPGGSGLHNPKEEAPPAPVVASTGGKARTEQVLDAPTKKFSLKQLQKDAK